MVRWSGRGGGDDDDVSCSGVIFEWGVEWAQLDTVYHVEDALYPQSPC